MAPSDCGWTCGCAGKTVRSLENTCHIPERCCGGVSLFEEALYQVYAPLPLPLPSPPSSSPRHQAYVGLRRRTKHVASSVVSQRECRRRIEVRKLWAAISWVSDVVATRFLRHHKSVRNCRAIHLESTVSTPEAKFFSCDVEKVNYRHLIPRWKTHFRCAQRIVSILRWLKVKVSTQFSRSEVEFLSSKVNLWRISWFDCFLSVDVDRKLVSGFVAGIWLSTN